MTSAFRGYAVGREGEGGRHGIPGKSQGGVEHPLRSVFGLCVKKKDLGGRLSLRRPPFPTTPPSSTSPIKIHTNVLFCFVYIVTGVGLLGFRPHHITPRPKPLHSPNHSHARLVYWTRSVLRREGTQLGFAPPSPAPNDRLAEGGTGARLSLWRGVCGHIGRPMYCFFPLLQLAFFRKAILFIFLVEYK